ncbi:DUF1634 domain-containing protein [Oscillospiraceae bacterium CM]|nr:DUF1634 domain-containing protein [Oscillospiraceae bacterium CM]
MKKDIRGTERAIAALLQVGVLLSAAVIFAGLVLFLATGVSGYEGNAYPVDLPAIVTGLLALKPYAVILTGLFILILTPFVRVGASMIFFIQQRDKAYTIITAIVLIILLISLFLGKTE